MAKKNKSRKPARGKAAPKKTKAKKKSAKKAAPKKTARKSPKKAAKKKSRPVAKKSVKKTVKKAAAVKKTSAKKPAARKPAAKKTIVKKPAPKKAAPKSVKPVASKPVEVLDTVSPATSRHEGSASSDSNAEHFKKHVTSLKVGDPAPFFEGVDQNGNRITSLDFPGKNIVLFFYPEDDTETCTIEACNLRDEFKYLADNNYAVVGVSPDSVDSHGKFADKYNLPYPLIADTDKAIIKAYDVWGPKQLFGRIYDGLVRTTFIIGFEGDIKNIITNVDAHNHAKQITSV